MMPGKKAVIEQIKEIAPHIRGGFVKVLEDMPGRHCVIGHTQPMYVPLHAIGVNLLEEVELAVEELTDEDVFYRTVGSVTLDCDKPYLKYKFREDVDANRRAAEAEKDDIEREFRKDLKNLQNDRVVTSGSTTGDRQWHR